MANKSGTSSQIISLPKGGGALHGIGEKFSPDLHTGTGNFTVPIALPPGRNGFQPQLNLVYSTGSGNGPFGLGWNLSIPGVSRKTSKGVPRYDDAKDVFILSGAEDLVPVERLETAATRYRPRTEGLFARIDHHRDATNDYWEVRSKDGLVSLYGTLGAAGHDPAVVAKPENRSKVFAWKLSRTTDPFGNRIEYEYERDIAEEGAHYWDQLYLKQIRYADYTENGETRFLVSVSFEYADRPDPFSEYRPGFEIRTHKRCARIVVHTHADKDRLVRVYELEYLDQRSDRTVPLPLNNVSLLSRVRVIGHDEETAQTQALPPLEFGYTQFAPERRDFYPLKGADLPSRSLANPDLELVDLFGNGLPDILEMNGTVRYWRNLGRGRFDLPRPMRDAPAGLALADPGVQLIDADGDGRTDLLVTTEAMSGYFPLQFGGQWDRRSFRRYRQAPSFNLEDPEVKLVDLDGDGVTDAIRSSIRLECFFNDPKEGWNNTRRVERQALESFPNINFSDPRVKWGDMSGDGLQDIVLVYDGNIEYWPNLGYGNWGKRISMRNNPRFPYGHDPRRILVGDVDGDGLADIAYVDDRKVILWINQSGNRWSDPIEIDGTPPVSDMDVVRLTDLLGVGVSGILWSADANGLSREHLFFLDFTGGLKPHLLNEMDNHMGAVTKVDYAPSTRFYLDDQKRLETQWKTPLPFPVHVVAKVEVIDQISHGKLTTEYRYHHGYWDGAEREFRGFGMVEQLDTESFEKYNESGLHGVDALFAQVDRKFFSAPTLTKTWFHQGPVGEEFGDWQELDYSYEYWSGDPQLLKHTESVNAFLRTLQDRRVKRDALRTLRGSILHTELYALDGSDQEENPYTVTEHSYGLQELDIPTIGDGEKPHIFFPHPKAQRTTQWERGNDPMTQFSFTRYTDDQGNFDPFGRPLAQTQIACPRGWRSLDSTPNEPYLATLTRTVYAKPINPQVYIHDRVAKTTTYEVVNTRARRLLELADLPDTSGDLKITGQTLNFYDGDAFIGLPFGQVGDFGALVRTETLVLTKDILQQAYNLDPPPYLAQTGNPVWTDDYPQEFRKLPALAGYTFQSDEPFATGYFAATERQRYDFHDPSGEKRGLVTAKRDPLGRDTTIAYDQPYHLLPTEVTDPVGLKTGAKYDYRVLQPEQVTDVNGNLTEFSFTPLGLLRETRLKGQKLSEGDQQRPSVRMEYEFLAFAQNKQPIFVRTIRHCHHDTETDIPLPKRDETITTVEYSDGFGRLLQTRTQAEEIAFGDSVFGDAGLPADQTAPNQAAVGQARCPTGEDRVVVSGWQTYDNKGRVVEKYEPFFACGWEYASPTIEQLGQKVTMFYDPRGQAIRTVNPDGSEQRVIYGIPVDLANPGTFTPTPWEAYTYDANDNAGRTHPNDPKARQYRHHWNTPSSIMLDALGRTVETVERDRDQAANPGDPLLPIKEYRTRSSYDIRGNLLVVNDALGRDAFKHVYDLANRPLRIDSIDAGIRRTVLDAAGSAIEQRDRKGALILHAYDVANRPTRLWARDDGNNTVTLRERLEYGDGGDPKQPAAERQANRLANRLGKLYRHYDEAGLLTFETYDFKGNVLEKARQVIKDEQILSVFSPPPANWEIQAYRVNWEPPAGATLASHAADLLDAQAFRTSATYDALNRIKVMLYPQDVVGQRRELRPDYNRAGALELVELAGKPFVEHIAYNAKGQRVLIAYGNGVMTRHAYDPQTFRLVRLRTERYAQPNPLTYQPTGAALQDFAYEYDLVGNITQIRDRTPDSGIPNSALGTDALNREFNYDPLYRLKSASGRECDTPPPIPPNMPWSDIARCVDLNRTRKYEETYEYDEVGNIRRLNHTHWRADGSPQGSNREFVLLPNTNRLNTVRFGMSPFAYEYDDNGNLTRENTERHFEWDYSDRMRVFRTQPDNAEPSVHAHYLYDASGQRVKKLVRKKGLVEVTVYIDSIFEHHTLTQGGVTNQNNTLHVMDNQSRIALVRVGEAFPGDGAADKPVKYHLGDHLGSSNVVIDDAGTLINREEFTPYGETSFGSFARKRYRFTGKERDEESGLYYHGARYYASWLGRWTSCDPEGVSDGFNVYAYGSNNPLVFKDPKGTNAEPSNPEVHANVEPFNFSSQLRLKPYNWFHRQIDPYEGHSSEGFGATLLNDPHFAAFRYYAEQYEQPQSEPSRFLNFLNMGFYFLGGELSREVDNLLYPVGWLSNKIDPEGHLTLWLMQQSQTTPIPYDDLISASLRSLQFAVREQGTNAASAIARATIWRNIPYGTAGGDTVEALNSLRRYRAFTYTETIQAGFRDIDFIRGTLNVSLKKLDLLGSSVQDANQLFNRIKPYLDRLARAPQTGAKLLDLQYVGRFPSYAQRLAFTRARQYASQLNLEIKAGPFVRGY